MLKSPWLSQPRMHTNLESYLAETRKCGNEAHTERHTSRSFPSLRVWSADEAIKRAHPFTDITHATAPIMARDSYARLDLPSFHLTQSLQHSLRATVKQVYKAQSQAFLQWHLTLSLVREGRSWYRPMHPLPYRIAMLDPQRPRVTGRPTFKQASSTGRPDLTALGRL